MVEATEIKLVKRLLKAISVDEIVYAEVAVPYAMGNSGGVVLYVFQDEEFICYETDVFSNENTYIAAEDLLVNHSEGEFLERQEAGPIHFIVYDAGMGNRVFLNKAVALKKGIGCFIYSKNDKDYKVSSTVSAVFDCVASILEEK